MRSLVERLTAEGVLTPAHIQRSGKHNERGWHTRSVNMILTRELYTGILTYADIRVEAPELAIINTSEASDITLDLGSYVVPKVGIEDDIGVVWLVGVVQMQEQ